MNSGLYVTKLTENIRSAVLAHKAYLGHAAGQWFETQQQIHLWMARKTNKKNKKWRFQIGLVEVMVMDTKIRLSFMNYSGYLGSNQFYVEKALSEPEIITLLKNKY